MRRILFLLILFVVISNKSESQTTSDSTKFEYIRLKAILIPAFFYSEIGVALDYFSDNHNYLELNINFIPYNYNINEGNYGEVDQNWNGQGFTVRLSNVSLYKTRNNKNAYVSVRLSYKYLYFPMYCYPDGSTGLDLTTWYNQTETRNLFFANFVFGRIQEVSRKFNIRSFFSLGFAIGKIDYTRYSYCHPDAFLAPFGPVRYKEESVFRPSAGLGIILSYNAFGK